MSDAVRLLSTVGFVSFDFTDVREPVFYGPDVDKAFDALINLYLVKDALARVGYCCSHGISSRYVSDAY